MLELIVKKANFRVTVRADLRSGDANVFFFKLYNLEPNNTVNLIAPYGSTLQM